jgi:hypothetical protein
MSVYISPWFIPEIVSNDHRIGQVALSHAFESLKETDLGVTVIVPETIVVVYRAAGPGSTSVVAENDHEACLSEHFDNGVEQLHGCETLQLPVSIEQEGIDLRVGVV